MKTKDLESILYYLECAEKIIFKNMKKNHMVTSIYKRNKMHSYLCGKLDQNYDIIVLVKNLIEQNEV